MTSTASRLDRLRVRHLRLLDLVARHGSLTAAAEQLGISQPTTTKLLQEMERILQCTLVDRSTRGGVLTEHGRRTLERIRPAIHSVDQLPEVAASAPQRPIVRVGILPLAGVALLPDLVRRLTQDARMPRMRLAEGGVADMLERLLTGEIDCVFGRLDPAYSVRAADALDITRLLDDPYEFVCTPQHPLARRRAVRLDELLDARWIVAPDTTYTRQVFNMVFVGRGLLPPQPLIESLSFHTSFALMAESPDLLTIAPSSAVRYYAELGKVRPIRLDVPFPPDPMVFVTRRELLTMPGVQDLRACLRELLERHLPR